MEPPIRRPEEILAFRTLERILERKPKVLWTVGPAESMLTALRIMAEKDIGFLVVMERDALVGVVSERDCARRVILAAKSSDATAVADVMVRDVVTADLAYTFADCLKLMHDHRIRHLPVVDKGKVVGVVSVRALLSEGVTLHGKIIAELERERLTIFTSTA